MKKLRTGNTSLAATLVVALVVALAIAPASEAGKRSNRSSDTKSTSPWLGVQIQTVDEDLVERYNLETKNGVYVEDVVDGSPAEDAGLRHGDIILEFNGAKLKTAAELIDLVADAQSGDEITLSISRNGRTLTEIVTLDERQRSMGRRFSAFGLGPDNSYSLFETLTNTYIGVSLETISGQLLDYFGADQESGALIKEVAEDTPAEKAGLKAGDVIVKVAGEEIESLTDVQDAVAETEVGESLNLTVLRDKREKSFTVTVEKLENSYFDRTPFDRYFGSQTPRRFGYWNQPRMRGLSRGSIGPDSWYFDMDEHKDEMERLRRQMRELRRELEQLREDVGGK